MTISAADQPTKAALLSYSAPAMPLAMLVMQIIVYIPPLYAIEAGISMAAVGGNLNDMASLRATAWHQCNLSFDRRITVLCCTDNSSDSLFILGS